MILWNVSNHVPNDAVSHPNVSNHVPSDAVSHPSVSNHVPSDAVSHPRRILSSTVARTLCHKLQLNNTST